jgi:hypothetical protein
MRPGRVVAVLSAWLLLAALLAAPALAQVPPKERRFVYGLTVFDGTEYTTSFVPPAVDTVYALADTDAVLDPKLTEVYFWPITNEYRADFTALNELVPGRLEVAQGGQVVESLELTEYVLQFDPAAGMGGGRVFLGDQAGQAWQHFLGERAAYLDRVRAHSDAVAAQQPAADPAPMSLYSSEIGHGFALRLPAGEYRIRVRDAAGQVVPDSEKRLLVVAPRRQGVGYEVVPQERWTYPEQASDPADVIYTMPGGVAYLQSFGEQELNALAYARLKNPQDLSRTENRWQWVQVGPLGAATLVVADGEHEQRLQTEQFAVEQVPGAALGYRVVPFDQRGRDSGAARAPDITAFRVQAPAERRTLSLRLVDADGRELAGSARELAVISAGPGWELALPVLAPLALGLSVVLWRREQVQRARSLPPEQRQRLV